MHTCDVARIDRYLIIMLLFLICEHSSAHETKQTHLSVQDSFDCRSFTRKIMKRKMSSNWRKSTNKWTKIGFPWKLKKFLMFWCEKKTLNLTIHHRFAPVSSQVFHLVFPWVIQKSMNEYEYHVNKQSFLCCSNIHQALNSLKITQSGNRSSRSQEHDAEQEIICCRQTSKNNNNKKRISGCNLVDQVLRPRFKREEKIKNCTMNVQNTMKDGMKNKTPKNKLEKGIRTNYETPVYGMKQTSK